MRGVVGWEKDRQEGRMGGRLMEKTLRWGKVGLRVRSLVGVPGP